MGVFDGLPDAFTGVLGQAVTVTPDGGGPSEIVAIFRSVSEDEFGVVTNRPMLHARADDVSNLADGDTVTVDGEDYTVRVLRPDGRGMTAIEMEKT